jgi:hypothetical protein
MVIVAVVWYGFRWADRISKQRGKREIGRDDADAGMPADAADAADAAADAADAAEDMANCEICNIFVSAEGARNCGRAGCPYPR